MGSNLQAAPQLCRKVRKFFYVKGNSVTETVVTSDIVVISLMGKCIVSARLNFLSTLIPGSIAVAAHYRKHASSPGSAPASGRIKGKLKACVDGDFLKATHVSLSPLLFVETAAVTVLVLHLNTDYWLFCRRSIFWIRYEVAYLLINLFVPFFYGRKIFLVICPDLIVFLQKPVRETSVTGFCMNPGTDSQKEL